jgi:hypothetical protein
MADWQRLGRDRSVTGHDNDNHILIRYASGFMTTIINICGVTLPLTKGERHRGQPYTALRVGREYEPCCFRGPMALTAAALTTRMSNEAPLSLALCKPCTRPPRISSARMGVPRKARKAAGTVVREKADGWGEERTLLGAQPPQPTQPPRRQATVFGLEKCDGHAGSATGRRQYCFTLNWARKVHKRSEFWPSWRRTGRSMRLGVKQ